MKKREQSSGEDMNLSGSKKAKRVSPISDFELFSRIADLYDENKTSTVESLMQGLCSRFPEYRRKPQKGLRGCVSQSLVHLRESQPIGGGGNNSHNKVGGSSSSRGVSESGEDEDEEFEEGEAGADEEAQARREAGNLMNTTLRRKYGRMKAIAQKNADEQNPQTQKTFVPPPPSSSSSSLGLAIPSVRYNDVGGVEHCLQDVRELIEHPIRHPEIYRHLGVKPPVGVLLHGPPGTGKTLLAHAIAGELGVPFVSISAPEIVSGVSGQSEKRLRQVFQEAQTNAPCLVFIDEIDAITGKRESAQREMERRIVAQLLTCMDDLQRDVETIDGEGVEPLAPVIVIGATNRPDSLDPALRRAGRFDREISMGLPDMAARGRILKVLCRKLRLQGDFQFDELARRTPGFVGADLVALTKEAAMIAVNRIFHDLFAQEEEGVVIVDDAVVHEKIDPLLKKKADEAEALRKREGVAERLKNVGRLTEEQLQHLYITMQDFWAALPKVQPSSKREGFATVPDVTWSEVGALEKVRSELQMAIVNAIRHPEAYASLGLSHPAGVLMYGPPGCGKTMLARAVANECQASFISVKGPELLNKYVGESERAVRQVFQRARASAPCVVFFDELDALAPRRGGESQASERVVNQLLTELDGLDSRKDVFVVAATNRPDIIDAAMLRPGRLEKLLYVPLPSEDDRVNILKTITKHRPKLAPEVDLENLGRDKRCTGFSGADLSALIRESAMAALSEAFNANGGVIPNAGLEVYLRHIDAAFMRVAPSVSLSDAKRYEAMQKSLSRNRMPAENEK